MKITDILMMSKNYTKNMEQVKKQETRIKYMKILQNKQLKVVIFGMILIEKSKIEIKMLVFQNLNNNLKKKCLNLN